LYFESIVNLFVLRTENKNTNQHSHYQQSFIVCEYYIVLKRLFIIWYHYKFFKQVSKFQHDSIIYISFQLNIARVHLQKSGSGFVKR
jgi:hypothetical protein